MVPRLRETRPVARGGQDAGITQPREHSLADPCKQMEDMNVWLLNVCHTHKAFYTQHK